jgi:2-polyprenyl-3-methyl-5-hydroxy-6-metoxy-1,4-benzoquinol methylase
MTVLLAERADVLVAVDVSSPSLAEVAKRRLPNVSTAQALIEEFDTSQRFDSVVLSEVIEHVHQPAEVIRKGLHLCKPGGLVLVTTPNGRWENHEHIQEFDAGTLSRVAGEVGFELFTIGYLRDRDNRRRWLTITGEAPASAAAPDDFFERRTGRNVRRRRRGE